MNNKTQRVYFVIPAKAGISLESHYREKWIPAFAGMTLNGVV